MNTTRRLSRTTRTTLSLSLSLTLVLVVVLMGESSASSHHSMCNSMSPIFHLEARYNDSLETLEIDVAQLVVLLCNYTESTSNTESTNNTELVFSSSSSETFTLRLELIAANERRRRMLERRGVCPHTTLDESKRNNTSKSMSKSKASLSSLLLVQETQYAESSQKSIFQHVQGAYVLRVSVCQLGVCKVQSCSHSIFLEAETALDEEVCQADPGAVQRVQVLDGTQLWHFHTCAVDIKAMLPLCSALKPYSMATVFTIEADEKECGIDHFLLYNKKAVTADLQLFPCPKSASLQGQICHDNKYINNDTDKNNNVAIVSHRLDELDRNISYCVYYQLNDPHCTTNESKLNNLEHQRLSCLTFARGKINCEQLQLWPSPLGSTLTSWPVFVVLVSLILIGSLCLLTCVVEQRASRRRRRLKGHHGDQSDHSPSILEAVKKPPRSLTEDDLEHISRLPSQEIVLVYFPDTKRFKELNRRLRNWLVTLDVNEVKDIFDEKCSDDVLSNPEKWVQEMLGGPEKRIILVCSRLAFECLQSLRRGQQSAGNAGSASDPHFTLLYHALHYLDREMRGNYRNLICVRYEDLKICSRHFSSEHFNIVPGTEYVLPQHLEDVYRWIHPRDPRPECWSDAQGEVRELLDAIRRYRHHDDNMFTVNFDTTNDDNLDSPCIE